MNYLISTVKVLLVDGDAGFDYVVVDAGTAEEHRPQPEEPPAEPLPESVAAVHEVVRDLEVQLSHMVTINQASQQEIDGLRETCEVLEHESLQVGS